MTRGLTEPALSSCGEMIFPKVTHLQIEFIISEKLEKYPIKSVLGLNTRLKRSLRIPFNGTMLSDSIIISALSLQVIQNAIKEREMKRFEVISSMGNDLISEARRQDVLVNREFCNHSIVLRQLVVKYLGSLAPLSVAEEADDYSYHMIEDEERFKLIKYFVERNQQPAMLFLCNSKLLTSDTQEIVAAFLSIPAKPQSHK